MKSSTKPVKLFEEYTQPEYLEHHGTAGGLTKQDMQNIVKGEKPTVMYNLTGSNKSRIANKIVGYAIPILKQENDIITRFKWFINIIQYLGKYRNTEVLKVGAQKLKGEFPELNKSNIDTLPQQAQELYKKLAETAEKLWSEAEKNPGKVWFPDEGKPNVLDNIGSRTQSEILNNIYFNPKEAQLLDEIAKDPKKIRDLADDVAFKMSKYDTHNVAKNNGEGDYSAAEMRFKILSNFIKYLGRYKNKKIVEEGIEAIIDTLSSGISDNTEWALKMLLPFPALWDLGGARVQDKKDIEAYIEVVNSLKEVWTGMME